MNNKIVLAATLWCTVCSASAHLNGHAGIDPTRIPLGDDKVSAGGPRVGYVYVCGLPRGGGGAHALGPWFNADGATWDATAKIYVQGHVSWPSSLDLRFADGALNISGNGLPDHATGIYPIRPSDPAFQYDRNPNAIGSQTISWRLPSHPQIAAQPGCLGMGAIGIMLSGVRLFNAVDAEGRDAVAHEVQDACEGHPERRGNYHYHSVSPCIVRDRPGEHSPLAGYAADGFGIYGNQGENGVPLTNADLDECHGHTHLITVNGQRKVEYHYHATREFPYTLGCFKGTPAVTEQRGMPGQRGRMNFPPPREALPPLYPQ